MSSTDLKSLSQQELFDRFVALSTEMGEVYGSSTRLYKRYQNQREHVLVELDARGLATAATFLPALRHENPWVRYGAARFCFKDAPEETLAVLKQLAGMTYHWLGPIAGMTLDSYAAGYRPTIKRHLLEKPE